MNEERKHIVELSISLPEIHAPGWILDLGGGGEGVIGQLGDRCGEKVVAIDRMRQELEDAPGGALKIVMDAGAMQFLDGVFPAAASFFFFFFVPPEERARIFAEVYRVLRPGGRWLIWDANIPPFPGGERDIYIVRLTVRLPDGSDIHTGYGALWPKQDLNSARLLQHAVDAGFEIAARDDGPLAFTLELRKPLQGEQDQP